MIRPHNDGTSISYTYPEEQVGMVARSELADLSIGQDGSRVVKILTPIQIKPSLAGLVDYLNQAGLFLHKIDLIHEMALHRLVGYGFSLEADLSAVNLHIYRPIEETAPKVGHPEFVMLSLSVVLSADATSFTIGDEMPIPFIRGNRMSLSIDVLQRRVLAIVRGELNRAWCGKFIGVVSTNLYQKPIVPLIIPHLEDHSNSIHKRVRLTIRSVIADVCIHKTIRFWMHLFAPSGRTFESYRLGDSDAETAPVTKITKGVISISGFLDPSFTSFSMLFGINSPHIANGDVPGQQGVRMYGQYQRSIADIDPDIRWDAPVEFTGYPFFVHHSERIRPKSVD